MIKTVTLDGEEIKVEGLAGQNTVIKNLGKSAVYASASPGITEGADGVIEISAGGGENLYGTNGTVYLLGSGKVQLTGVDYSNLNCVFASAGASGGSGSSGSNDDRFVITKEEIDSLFDKAPSGGSNGGFVITKEEIDKLFK